MNGKKYRKYVDYGPSGESPERLHGKLDPTDYCEVPPALDNQIETVWNQLQEERPELHDSNVMNLIDIGDRGYTLEFGRVSFPVYYVLWLSLRNVDISNKIRLTDEQREFVERRIHATSSHSAIVTRNEVIFGRKLIEGGYWIDFPGSGYLDILHDTNNANDVHAFDRIVRREIQEELAISDCIENIECLGIYSEETDGIAVNPAVLSVAKADAPPAEILRQAQEAEDSWEFTDLFTVPLSDKSAIESIIVDRRIPSTLISGQENDEYAVTPLAPKAPLLLALLGRQKYGEAWFQSVTAESGMVMTTGGVSGDS